MNPNAESFVPENPNENCCQPQQVTNLSRIEEIVSNLLFESPYDLSKSIPTEGSEANDSVSVNYFANITIVENIVMMIQLLITLRHKFHQR